VSYARSRAGFSIVEVFIALMILTFGLFAMASATGYASLEVRLSAARTQRTAAVGGAIEQIRANASTSDRWSTLASRDSASAWTINGFKVWYTAAAPVGSRKDITIFSLGPGYAKPDGWQLNVKDTDILTLARPQ
jgi:Tfp pilus assembly protein PilV